MRQTYTFMNDDHKLGGALLRIRSEILESALKEPALSLDAHLEFADQIAVIRTYIKQAQNEIIKIVEKLDVGKRD